MDGMLISLFFVTVFAYAVLLISKPHEIVRPSVWFSINMLVHISGAAALTGAAFDHGYERAWTLRCLAILFPLGIVGWRITTPRLSFVAKGLYRSCQSVNKSESSGRFERQILIVFASISAVILFVYLSAVPLKTTGLVTLFVDPSNATMAREKSLALLESRWLQYSFQFHFRVLAPLILSLLLLRRPRGVILWVFWLVLVVSVFLSVMLTGARGPAGILLLGVALFYLLRNGLAKGVIVLGLIAGLALLIATFLTIFREGRIQELSLGLVYRGFVRGSMGRMLLTPFKTGVWTSLYAYENGLLGIQNIRPLAILWGVDYVNLPNVVAMTNLPDPIPSTTANTCFLFDYQASFGLALGWLISFFLLCALDLGLLVLRRVPTRLLIPFLVTFLLSTRPLVASAYTTSLVTHGLLPVLLLASIVGALRRGRSTRQADQPVGLTHKGLLKEDSCIEED